MGGIETDTLSSTSALGFHVKATTALPVGYAMTGCGALVNWSNAGNLLWKMQPSIVTGNGGWVGHCEADSKDHDFPSGATIRAFALGMRLVP